MPSTHLQVVELSSLSGWHRLHFSPLLVCNPRAVAWSTAQPDYLGASWPWKSSSLQFLPSLIFPFA